MKKPKTPSYIFFRVLISISLLYGLLMAPIALFLFLSNAPEFAKLYQENETSIADSLSIKNQSNFEIQLNGEGASVGWDIDSDVNKSFNKKHEHKTFLFTFLSIIIAFVINLPFKRYLRKKRKNKPISERLNQYCKRFLQYMPLINTAILVVVFIVYHIAEYFSITNPESYSCELEHSLSKAYFFISTITSVLVVLFTYFWLKHRLHFKYVHHFFDEKTLQKNVFSYRSGSILSRILSLSGMTTFFPIAVISTYIVLSITTLADVNISSVSDDQTKVLLGSFYNLVTSENIEVNKNIQWFPYIPSLNTIIMLMGISMNIIVTLIYILFFVRWTTSSIKIPITDLLNKMKTVSSGKWGETTIVRTNDEFGVLSEGFNEMSQQLKSYFDELTDLNKNLEQKVVDRTAKIEQQKEEIISQRDEIEAQRDEIEAQRDSVTKQRDEIITQKKEITDSIEYARLIQSALFPPEQILINMFPESFILFKPKDIVSGDFYWFHKKENQLIIMAGDCTGHGVPGAFMSMLGISLLNEIVHSSQDFEATEILNQLRKQIVNSFHQKADSEETKDGMDVALLIIDTEIKKESELEYYYCQFAGANNPLYIVKSEKLKVKSEENTKLDELSTFNFQLDEVKGNKMPIAIHEKMDSFTTHKLKLYKNDTVYLFSDGYADQFGGNNGKKFKYQALKKMLLENNHLPMQEQKNILLNTFENWRGELEQVDDVLVLGINIT